MIRRVFWVLILLGVALGIVLLIRTISRPPVSSVTHSQTDTPSVASLVPSEELPSIKQLAVPFTVQAPLGAWDALHEEACEEASLLMVVAARNNQLFGSAAGAEAQIQELVHWETAHGYSVDVTVSELSRIAAERFNLPTARMIENPTVEIIKQEVAAGHPVIVPAAGRLLGNPNFTPPGPIYHMLVITGYTETAFVVNDPGTKRGENYPYAFEHILNALHDWNPVDITLGAKKVLVFD